MRIKLIASGDSFTYGYGLDDAQNAWPYRLAYKLECDVVNLAIKSMGNEHVFNSIIDYFICNPNDIDNSIVILGLSEYSRVEFIHAHDKKRFCVLPYGKFLPQFSQIFLKDFYDDEYYYTRFLRNLIFNLFQIK
jgi:hypothetical protein